MIRVLVVSAQTMIAMSLQDEYEVTAVDPGDLAPPVVERGYVVTVIDAADVDATVQLMPELAREHTGPLVLLAHDEQSALALDAAKGLADVRIGPPLSGAALRDTLHGIARASVTAPQEPVAAEPVPPLVAPVPKAHVPAGLRRDSGELNRRLQGRRPERSTLERAGTPADLLSLAQGLPTQDTARSQPRRSAPKRQQMTTIALAEALLDRVPGLLGLAAVATAVADNACESASGTAAAVLVGDGDRCVVAAGLGLRPLEKRLQLDAEHWLVREVVRASHGLIIEDTDIARGDLVGAPLSASEHLLVVPIEDVAGLVMVARDGKGAAFTSAELEAVAALAAEAASPLREAVQVRELGRALAALDAE